MFEQCAREYDKEEANGKDLARSVRLPWECRAAVQLDLAAYIWTNKRKRDDGF